MKDAKHLLKIAKEGLKLGWYRTVIQNSQMAIEDATKAIIACVAQPEWTHSPDEQLLKIIDSQKNIIKEKLGEEMINSLIKLADNVKQTTPWHGWCAYGKKR